MTWRKVPIIRKEYHFGAAICVTADVLLLGQAGADSATESEVAE